MMEWLGQAGAAIGLAAFCWFVPVEIAFAIARRRLR